MAEENQNELIRRLEEKFAQEKQPLATYLEGLLHSDYLKYWDYINLDALLSLQHPRTNFPDEKTFILYHQITELYFRLIRNAIELVAEEKNLTAEFFVKQLQRVVNYFGHLSSSFSVMLDGMDRGQFLAFRLALAPASGFQSAQYRIIEIYSTDLINLIRHDKRSPGLLQKSPAELLELVYWKQGGLEAETGRKTLTLRQFEEKYQNEFIGIASMWNTINLRQRYHSLPEAERKNAELIDLLRRFDHIANVNWPLVHYKTAARYMDRKPDEVAATGGTNWKQYLAPKNQLIQFFPELWSKEETEKWGMEMWYE